MRNATVIKFSNIVKFLDENNKSKFTRKDLHQEFGLCIDRMDFFLEILFKEGKIQKSKSAQVCLYSSIHYIKTDIKKEPSFCSIAAPRRPIISDKIYKIDKKMEYALSRCNLHSFYTVQTEEVAYYAE